MKTLITLILFAFVITSGIAQEKNIETKSIELDNLISFVIQNYSVSDEESEFDVRNITFLIQVSEAYLDIESQVILKQAFKILSKRLSSDDYISIIAYSGFNGIALEQTAPQDLKKILYTLNNLKPSVKELHIDGIELAYIYAEDNFEKNAINTVVMVRNPNRNNNINSNIISSPVVKKKNSTVLITAISLLPEIIAVIKN